MNTPKYIKFKGAVYRKQRVAYYITRQELLYLILNSKIYEEYENYVRRKLDEGIDKEHLYMAIHEATYLGTGELWPDGSLFRFVDPDDAQYRGRANVVDEIYASIRDQIPEDYRARLDNKESSSFENFAKKLSNEVGSLLTSTVSEYLTEGKRAIDYEERMYGRRREYE